MLRDILWMWNWNLRVLNNRLMDRRSPSLVVTWLVNQVLLLINIVQLVGIRNNCMCPIGMVLGRFVVLQTTDGTHRRR